MPTGIYINHGNGNVIDMTRNFGAFLGSFSTDGAVNGAHTDTALIGREFYYISVYVGTAQSFALAYTQPIITFNSTTGQMAWRYSDTTASLSERRKHEITYGAF